MAGGGCGVAGITVTALRAGKGRITGCGTGRSRDLGGIAVTGSRNGLGLGAAALGAGVSLNAGGRTGSSLGDHTAVICMAATVAALGANAIDIAVAGGGCGVAGITVTALGAGIGRITGCGTGGSRYLGGIVVACCRNGLGLSAVALGAGVGLNAGGSTGSCLGDHTAVICMAAAVAALRANAIDIAVAGGGCGVAGITVTALGAGIGRITGCGTGGSRYLGGIVVACCRNGLSLGAAALGAGVSLNAGSGTSSRFCDHTAAPAVGAGRTTNLALAAGPAMAAGHAANRTLAA